MRLIIFLLLIPFNAIAKDYLLEAMFADYENEPSDEYSELESVGDAEVYHWDESRPDNEVELEIIYEDASPCKYR